MNFVHELGNHFVHALKNLLPIVLVVATFQLLVFGTVPEDTLSIVVGLFIVAVGVALFLQGLELSIFPVGKSLSNQFTRRGSIPVLLCFGFALGFSAVIAEPALIAVALQAQEISQGRIDALTLRILVAVSVGFVVALGVFRIIFGHPIHWYMIIGYSLVVIITFFAPEEIVGLAYDSGGVTTNIVTVPLIAALGIGLASSIRGRNPLVDGFGLVALAVMVPMISVQLYGILVYNGNEPQGDRLITYQSELKNHPPLLSGVMDLLTMIRDVLPILITILFFQYIILKRPLSNPKRVTLGFILVIFGLYAFIIGLKLGLFPIGRSMAEQLITLDGYSFVYLFAFMIGFATTMAEPALIAVGKQAEEAAAGRINGKIIRLLVALGVAFGITIGVYRLIEGFSIHYFIIGGYALVILLTLLTPKYIVALAYDLGGVTTSEVTVPLVTALGIGLATHIEGRNVLIDGFGLIAFASIFPIVTVLSYALAVHWMTLFKKRSL